jgi:molecular chaperone DnaK
MAVILGIDLGTTNSAVAILDDDGTPRVLPNPLGERVTPSVVGFRNGEVVVGREAKELQAAGEPQVAAFFKRQMGVAHYTFFAAGRDHTAVDLSAFVLDALKRGAEGILQERVRDAVITVPAYFRNPQREATIAAGRQAGLNVLQVVNEPTAAAVAFGFRRSSENRTLLVYDLGGGTFDVTALRLGRGEIRVLSSDGDHELGGKDWDDRILAFLASRFEAEFGSDPLADRESMADLAVRTEEVKKRLSATESAPIAIVHEGHRASYILDRATFAKITADLMERTIALCTKVLDEQGLSPRAVDGVLLVGGSTRMPMVREFIRRTFDQEPMTGVNPDEAVALGAALVAAGREQTASGRPRPRLAGAVRTVDVTNHSLGMIALNEDRSAYINSLILPKNRPIPCTETRPYVHRTRGDAENRLEIFMTQGESDSPADIAYLGLYVLHDVPHTEGQPSVLDIEYQYDESGTVQVRGRSRATGGALRLTVEPLPPDIPDRFLRPPALAQEPLHVTAYLAFDLSGSMSGPPLAEAQKAARRFLSQVDLAHCSVGLIAFADRVKVKLAACQNTRTIDRAIDGLRVGEVGTCNGADPFAEVLARLAKLDGPRFVITLADGVWADQPRAIERARACHEAGIQSIAVGFGEADRVFLRAIASADEASFFTSLGELTETFSTIAQVITESGDEGGASGEAGHLAFLHRPAGR